MGRIFSSRSAQHSSAVKEYRFDPILVIRLSIATVLLVLSLLVSMNDILRMVILIVAAVIAGYDLIFKAINNIFDRDYFHSDNIILITALITFFISFEIEGVALLILYQIGLLLIDYSTYRTRKTALEFITNEEISEYIDKVFKNQYISQAPFESKVSRITNILTKAILVFAILYAIILPWISNFSYIVSIHRALTMLVIATPISILCSLFLINLVGLAYVAEHGMLFNSAKSYELFSDVGTVIYDKDGIITGGTYKIDFINPGKMSAEEFIKMASHIIYRSSSPFADAILDAYQGEINEDLIDQFGEVPGLGFKIIVNGVDMGLMTKKYCETKGYTIPIISSEGTTLYLIVANEYIGHITLSEQIDSQAKQLINDLSDHGIDCILVSSEDKDTCTKFARTVDVTEFYYEYDDNKKLELINSQKQNPHLGKILHLHRKSLDAHTAADIDAIYKNDDDISDVLVERNCLDQIIFSIDASKKSMDIALENVIASIVVKVILIVLTLIGFCNIWFAIFIDVAVAIGTILNSIRAGISPNKRIKTEENDY